jgi:hypothetical protein
MAKPSATMTATPLEFAVEKRALDSQSRVKGTILKFVPKSHKYPRISAAYVGFYKKGDSITIICYTNSYTDPVDGNA